MSRSFAVLSGLILAGAAGWVLSGAGRDAPAAPAAPLPAVRWEYCFLGEDLKKCVYSNSTEAVEAKSWVEVAKALKIPLKGEKPDHISARAQVFDHLGAQGWELASETAMANDTSLAHFYTFKRRLP